MAVPEPSTGLNLSVDSLLKLPEPAPDPPDNIRNAIASFKPSLQADAPYQTNHSTVRLSRPQLAAIGSAMRHYAATLAVSESLNMEEDTERISTIHDILVSASFSAQFAFAYGTNLDNTTLSSSNSSSEAVILFDVLIGMLHGTIDPRELSSWLRSLLLPFATVLSERPTSALPNVIPAHTSHTPDRPSVAPTTVPDNPPPHNPNINIPITIGKNIEASSNALMKFNEALLRDGLGTNVTWDEANVSRSTAPLWQFTATYSFRGGDRRVVVAQGTDARKKTAKSMAAQEAYQNLRRMGELTT